MSRARSRRSARPGRRRSPVVATSRVWSNAPAPRSETSSCGVKSSSIPACPRPSSSTRRTASSMTTTAALLSEPRIVPAALRTMPSSPTTGSIDRLRRHGVRVRAEEDRRPAPVRGRNPAVDVPGVAVETSRRVVLVPREPELREVCTSRGRRPRAPSPTGSAARRARGRGRGAATSTAAAPGSILARPTRGLTAYIHPSPNVDWGYDVSDYPDVHPDLGTLEDVDRLIAEARA